MLFEYKILNINGKYMKYLYSNLKYVNKHNMQLLQLNVYTYKLCFGYLFL